MIKIQNVDENECLKWCLVRYLHLDDKNLARIRKIGKYFGRQLDFKDILFFVKFRNTHKIEKNLRQH